MLRMSNIVNSVLSRIKDKLTCYKEDHILTDEEIIFFRPLSHCPSVEVRKKCSRCKCWITIKVLV